MRDHLIIRRRICPDRYLFLMIPACDLRDVYSVFSIPIVRSACVIPSLLWLTNCLRRPELVQNAIRCLRRLWLCLGITGVHPPDLRIDKLWGRMPAADRNHYGPSVPIRAPSCPIVRPPAGGLAPTTAPVWTEPNGLYHSRHRRRENGSVMT